jgi:hypothetical protein
MVAETHNLVHSDNLETLKVNERVSNPTGGTYKVAVGEV